MVVPLEVKPSVELRELKKMAIKTAKIEIPPGYSIFAFHQGRKLFGDHLTLEEHGLVNMDFVTLDLKPGIGSIACVERDGLQIVRSDVEFIRDQILSNTCQLQILQKTNPQMAEALLNNDYSAFSELIDKILQHDTQLRDAKIQELQKFQEIESKNKKPPSFEIPILIKTTDRSNTLILLPVKLQEISINAIINSGSSKSYISKSCVKHAKLESMVEIMSKVESPPTSPRNRKETIGYATISTALNPVKFIGIIHNCPIQIQDRVMMGCLDVMDGLKSELMIGMDLLRSHECILDFGKNCLTFGISLPFAEDTGKPSTIVKSKDC